MSKTENTNPSAVAVYCGSSPGNKKAYAEAAKFLGRALARSGRTLVYGGGAKGIMGVVSNAAVKEGGSVVGIIPQAMVAAGGEGERVRNPTFVYLDEVDRSLMETIIVESMHERKVEMARRVGSFVGLPGGFGTFEEVLEVTTWTQLGIHDKPVVLLNVLSFWEPLRALIRGAIESGFIRDTSERLVIFVDGPENQDDHETFDWGKAALEAIDSWEVGNAVPLFDWSKREAGSAGSDALKST